MTSLLLAIIYIAFISLGLPDALLGSAWPSMYPAFGVPVSYMGILSMIIALGTVVSSLMSDRMTRALGTGRVTALSVGMTAVALLGFSFSSAYRMLVLWAIPYGLGAGSVDASLNNYVALHYESRHMSWLHCMWGIGAAIGPYIMSWALTGMHSWNMGYRVIGVMQVVLTAILFISLPLWKGRGEGLSPELSDARQAADVNDEVPVPDVSVNAGVSEIGLSSADTERDIDCTAGSVAVAEEDHILSLTEIIRIPGVREILLCFFSYSAVEQTTGLWAASYLTLVHGVSAETAAGFASLFYIGITVGRAASGFITMKLDDENMIRMGQGIIAVGIAAMLIPGPDIVSLAGFVLIGLGCAPIYPCIIHSTPAHFGADRSQAIIGVQMASAYIGTTLMPPLFGLIANNISAALLPFYVLIVLVLMILMHERLLGKV